jgi:hypothetical protein
MHASLQGFSAACTVAVQSQVAYPQASRMSDIPQPWRLGAECNATWQTFLLVGKPSASLGTLQVWKQPGWPLPNSQDGVFVQLDSLKAKRLYYLPLQDSLLRLATDWLVHCSRSHRAQLDCWLLLAHVHETYSHTRHDCDLSGAPSW